MSLKDGRWRMADGQGGSICHLLSAICLLVSCTDPRARPAPPVLEVLVSPSFELHTPGTILASLHAFDEEGLNFLEMSIRNTTGTLTGDSLVVLDGVPELTRPIIWQVPAGLLIGSQVSLAVRVMDLTGFASVDTLHFTVQDTLSGVR